PPAQPLIGAGALEVPAVGERPAVGDRELDAVLHGARHFLAGSEIGRVYAILPRASPRCHSAAVGAARSRAGLWPSTSTMTMPTTAQPARNISPARSVRVASRKRPKICGPK